MPVSNRCIDGFCELLEPTGMTTPGLITMLYGFVTPSSVAVYIPDKSIAAFCNTNSFTLFKERTSGNACTAGPLPRISPAVFEYLPVTQGLDLP